MRGYPRLEGTVSGPTPPLVIGEAPAMPIARRSRILERAAYARNPNANGGFLVNDPDGFPSDYPPAMWWIGVDSGGGATPIGPNGPWPNGWGAAVPAVTRATSLITGPLTVAPFRVLDNGSELPAPRWLIDPMLARPDARVGVQLAAASMLRVRSVFWAEWIRAALWFGLGAIVWLPDADGGPMAGTLGVVHPQFLHTTEGAGGALVWEIDGGEGDPWTFDRDGVLEGGDWRITVLRNPLSPTDTEGMSLGVFAMSPGVFSLSGNIEQYQAGQFRSGVPNGYLKTDVPGMTQTQADNLKSKWLATHGSSSRRSIAVLNSTTAFVPLNLSPVDAALDQVKRLNVADVAFAFGLDPMTLGAGLNNSATYTNLRDAWENHRDFGLGPWIAAAQDTLSSLLPGTQTVTVNLDGFANPALSERVSAGVAAVNGGLISADEWRASEGLPPLSTNPPEVPA